MTNHPNRARLSRATMTEYAQARAEYLQGRYDFDPRNGTRQLLMPNPFADDLVDRAVGYGEWQAMLELIAYLEKCP
jgi:hypothetical protein